LAGCPGIKGGINAHRVQADRHHYVPAFDAQDDVRTGWLETSGSSVVNRHADDRFASAFKQTV
jgi:hypothetical protein